MYHLCTMKYKNSLYFGECIHMCNSKFLLRYTKLSIRKVPHVPSLSALLFPENKCHSHILHYWLVLLIFLKSYHVNYTVHSHCIKILTFSIRFQRFNQVFGQISISFFSVSEYNRVQPRGGPKQGFVVGSRTQGVQKILEKIYRDVLTPTSLSWGMGHVEHSH